MLRNLQTTRTAQNGRVRKHVDLPAQHADALECNIWIAAVQRKMLDEAAIDAVDAVARPKLERSVKPGLQAVVDVRHQRILKSPCTLAA